ncbi:MAG: hypothetical protein QM681_16850 [Novosphingobium sp.]
MEVVVLLPLDSMSLIALDQAKPGQFLFDPKSNDRKSLRLLSAGDGQRRLFSISKEGDRVHTSEHSVGYGLPPFVTYTNSRLMADPDSLVHPTQNTLSFGTLLLTARGPGILFEAQSGHDAVFLLSGEVVETQWGSDVGFYRWEVEALDEDRSPTSLFAIDVPPPAKFSSR